jgi:putative transposase
MSFQRFKTADRVSVHHCISRVVGGEFLLDDLSKEQLRKMIWKQSVFSGVEIITYCLMDNHAHFLIRIPPLRDLTDDEIIQRIEALYGKRSHYATLITECRQKKTPLDPYLRKRLIARMGDVSVFMKELKQRFSLWYNHQFNRFGTLWAERFKSVLIEDQPSLLRLVSAYIDLNPVRAGIVNDPKDYRFCGYSEALAGNQSARQGIASIHDDISWKTVAAAYRQMMFVKAGSTTHSSKTTLDRDAILSVVNNGGTLPPSTLLRLRVRYMTEGGVLGSATFVNEMFHEFRHHFGNKRESGARRIRYSDLEHLYSFRDLQNNVIS